MPTWRYRWRTHSACCGRVSSAGYCRDAAGGPEQVLEIGTGTGFVTACLRGMAGRVRALVELYPDLADSARANLAALGVRGAEVLEADALGFESATRFDVIAVTASLPIYGPHFERMLKVGGRLFVAVGEAPVYI